MKETIELTDGSLDEFSEPWSEAYRCQSQGSQGDDFFKVNSPVHLLVLNFQLLAMVNRV